MKIVQKPLKTYFGATLVPSSRFFEAAVARFDSLLRKSLMIFVFTAVILFFTVLFWSIDRLNRGSHHEHVTSLTKKG